MTFKREPDNTPREKWIWTDPAVTPGKRAFNGRVFPILIAICFILLIGTIFLKD